MSGSFVGSARHCLFPITAKVGDLESYVNIVRDFQAERVREARSLEIVRELVSKAPEGPESEW